jgi:hypothetical protein
MVKSNSIDEINHEREFTSDILEWVIEEKYFFLPTDYFDIS